MQFAGGPKGASCSRSSALAFTNGEESLWRQFPPLLNLAFSPNFSFWIKLRIIKKKTCGSSLGRHLVRKQYNYIFHTCNCGVSFERMDYIIRAKSKVSQCRNSEGRCLPSQFHQDSSPRTVAGSAMSILDTVPTANITLNLVQEELKV